MENNNTSKRVLKEKIGSVVYVVNKAYTSYTPLQVKKITEKYVHFEDTSTKISVDDIDKRIFFTLKEVKEAIKDHDDDSIHSIEADIMDKNEYSKTRYIVLKDNTIYEGILMKKFIKNGEKYLEYLLRCGVDCFGIRGTTTILESEQESYVFETKEEAIFEVIKRKRKAGDSIYVVYKDYSSIEEYSLYSVEGDTILLSASSPSGRSGILKDLDRVFFTEEDADVLVAQEAAEMMLDLLKIPSAKPQPSVNPIETYRVDYNQYCNRFEINQHDISPDMYKKVTDSYINHESVEYVFLDMENAIEYARYLNNMKQVIRIPTLGEKIYIIDPIYRFKYDCGIVINITGYNIVLDMMDGSRKMFSLLETGYTLEEPSKEEAATLAMYITTKFEASLQKNRDSIYNIPVLFSVEKDSISNKRFTAVTCGFDTMKECNEHIEDWIKNNIKFFFSFNEADKYTSFMNVELITDKLLNKFDASFRIKEIKDEFENLVKDGFEIGTHNGKFYIKNPNMCDVSDVSSVYAEIDLSALSNEKINFIEILKYRKPVYVLTRDLRSDDYKGCAVTCFYPALINTDAAILKVHPMYQNMNSNVLTHQTIVVYKKDLNSKFFLSVRDAIDYFNKNYRNK